MVQGPRVVQGAGQEPVGPARPRVQGPRGWRDSEVRWPVPDGVRPWRNEGHRSGGEDTPARPHMSVLGRLPGGTPPPR